MSRKWVWAGLILSAVVACSDDEFGPNISGVGGEAILDVRIQPTVDTIYIADSARASDQVKLTAIAVGRTGAPIQVKGFVWRSSDPTVAHVDTAGVVTALALGTVEITASAYRVAKATVVILPEVTSVTVSSSAAQVLAGDTLQLTATVLDHLGQPIRQRITWSSANAGVARVDSTGRVIFTAPGTVAFTAATEFGSGTVTVTALARKLLSVDAGGDFTCGVASLGRGYCWGKGGAGQLGSAADSTCFDDLASPAEARVDCAIAPKPMGSPSIAFSVIAAGDSTACGISTQQLLYCWGDDVHGQVGNGQNVGGAEPKHASVGGERFTALSSGSGHSCALNITGLAYCWGKDSTGQLGDHRRVNSTTPIPVVGTTGLVGDAQRFTRISAGGAHTCAITAAGSAYCWGDGRRGALGNGGASISDVPVPVTAGEPLGDISAGRNHSCGVAPSGNLYCWGANDFGQVGTVVPPASQLTPRLVGGGYIAVSAGDFFTCALTTGRAIHCWGSNSHGQLGRGEPNPTGTSGAPSGVVGGITFTSVSAGRRHACGMGADGETYCWGANMLGALGSQLQAALRSAPQKVAALR